MKAPCTKCTANVAVESRPSNSAGRDDGGVIWKVYAVCGNCGTTSVYTIHGRPLHTVDDWVSLKPHQPPTTDQMEMQL